ncbi:MAG: hypothetical protein QOD42_490 [Sphingomonadales bacterium]|jgi:hypothetical protein|nr:hypothetical protein [Sphingomonadales bacterium]
MKGFALLLGGTLLIGGCGQAEGPLVKDLVRDTLAPNGNVQQVEMTKQGDNSFSGYGTVRLANGTTTRFNCTANRRGNSYVAQCRQAIDQALIDELKASLRQSFTAQGLTVVQLELSRQDDDHVTGHVDVRAGDGSEARLPCSGTREPNGRVPVECRAPATQTAQPPAEQGAQPAEPEAAPAEEGGEQGQ